MLFAALGHLQLVEAGELGVLLAGGVGGMDLVVRSSEDPAWTWPGPCGLFRRFRRLWGPGR
jgi:hypothetical protein